MNFANIFFSSIFLISVMEEYSCAKLCVRPNPSVSLLEMFVSANKTDGTTIRWGWHFSEPIRNARLNACHQALQAVPELNVGYVSEQLSRVTENGVDQITIVGTQVIYYISCILNSQEIRLIMVKKMHTLFVSKVSPSSRNTSILLECIHLNPKTVLPLFEDRQLKSLRSLTYSRNEEPVAENPMKHLLPEEDTKLCELALATARPDVALTSTETNNNMRLAFENPEKLGVYPNISYKDKVVMCHASDGITYYLAYAYKNFDAYLAVKLEWEYGASMDLYRALLIITNISVLDMWKDETNVYHF